MAPHFGSRVRGVDGRGDVEEVEDLVLERGQFWFEDLDDLVAGVELVALEAVEDLQDAGALGAGQLPSSG